MPDIAMAPYVLAAYMGAWLVLMGYIVYLATKMSRLQKEIEHLSELLKKK